MPSPSDLANYGNRSSANMYGSSSGKQGSSGLTPSPHWAHLLPAGASNGGGGGGGADGRLASTPPSSGMEDESAQALLDQWCQEVRSFFPLPLSLPTQGTTTSQTKADHLALPPFRTSPSTLSLAPRSRSSPLAPQRSTRPYSRPQTSTGPPLTSADPSARRWPRSAWAGWALEGEGRAGLGEGERG